MENLAQYIIRAFLPSPASMDRRAFSQGRMTYLPEKSRVIQQSRDGKEQRPFDTLEWLAAMCAHTPNKGEQMVRYYSYYSNLSRGRRQKED